MSNDPFKLTKADMVIKWILWKPLYVIFRYVITPLVTKLNDAVQDAHHAIVRKSTKGEWPF